VACRGNVTSPLRPAPSVLLMHYPFPSSINNHVTSSAYTVGKRKAGVGQEYSRRTGGVHKPGHLALAAQHSTGRTLLARNYCCQHPAAPSFGSHTHTHTHTHTHSHSLTHSRAVARQHAGKHAFEHNKTNTGTHTHTHTHTG
jgi:hypothetical protein